MIAPSGGHVTAEIEEGQSCFLAKPYRMETILVKQENRISSARFRTAALAC